MVLPDNFWSRICVEDDSNLQLGQSVSISGDGTLLIASGVGDTILYEYDSDTWIIREKFKSRLAENFNGGYSSDISRDGSHIIVGAPYESASGHNKGAAQIFIFDDDEWLQKGITIIGDKENDEFGFDVGLSNDGTKILVSAPGGRYARVFTFESPQWVYNSKNNFGNRASDSLFGYSSSISGSGDFTVIGAPAFNSNVGLVRAYDLIDHEVIDQILDDSPENDFGAAVTVSEDGTSFAVGDPNHGIVRVYRKNILSNTWVQVGKDILFQSEKFGSSLALIGSGAKIVVGAPENSFNGTKSGATYVFEYDPLPDGDVWPMVGDWKQKGDPFYGFERDEKCGLDVSLSSDGTRIVTSCPGADNNRGRVCVYSEPAVTDDTFQPSLQPTMMPTTHLSNSPSFYPTIHYSKLPSIQNFPTNNPTNNPTKNPTNNPTKNPTAPPVNPGVSIPSPQPPHKIVLTLVGLAVTFIWGFGAAGIFGSS